MRESLFEPLLRQMRIQKVLPVIRERADCVLLDVGCGFNHRFLSTIEPYIREGHGIDFKVPEVREGRITTHRALLDGTLPFPDATFDVVTMLAVLEHLSKPLEIVREIERVLKPGGCLVLTVPSKAAEPVLEFLALKVGVVSRDEILDHKQYFNRGELETLFAQTGLRIERHRYFQLFMNNFCVVRKPEPLRQAVEG
jgi:2-polyprenyl-3-methyl-5-hydroxy-6-metoxy-1,4-benzoquinol methylase